MRVYSMIAGVLLSAVSVLRHKNKENGRPLVNGPATEAELEAVLVEAEARRPEAKNRRTSIVDLLKILWLPSSLAARKDLADEYKYRGDAKPGSAEWNQWLHEQTMIRLRDGRLLPFGDDDD